MQRRGDAGPLPALAMQIMAHTIKTAGEDVLEAALMRDVVHVALIEMAAVKVSAPSNSMVTLRICPLASPQVLSSELQALQKADCAGLTQ